MHFNKTRLAPTPSGYLHIGNLYSFALTQQLAEKYGAKLWLRIDDLDQQRVRPEYIQFIFDALSSLEFKWDEGPRNPEDFKQHHSQMQRLPVYEAALNKLANANKLFACRCSRTSYDHEKGYPGTCRDLKIPLGEPGVNWRLRIDESNVAMRTLEEIQQHAYPESMHYMIVRKKDGMPSYHLASVIDDTDAGIDLIVRGEDLKDSSLGQIVLARALDLKSFEQIRFVHHKLIKDEHGEKLAKSSGSHSAPPIELTKSAKAIKEALLKILS